MQRGLGRAPEVSAPGPARPQPPPGTHSPPTPRAPSPGPARTHGLRTAALAPKPLRTWSRLPEPWPSVYVAMATILPAGGAVTSQRLPTSRTGAAQLRGSAGPRFLSFLGLHHSAPLLLIFLHSLIHFFTVHQVARGTKIYLVLPAEWTSLSRGAALKIVVPGGSITHAGNSLEKQMFCRTEAEAMGAAGPGDLGCNKPSRR